MASTLNIYESLESDLEYMSSSPAHAASVGMAMRNYLLAYAPVSGRLYWKCDSTVGTVGAQAIMYGRANSPIVSLGTDKAVNAIAAIGLIMTGHYDLKAAANSLPRNRARVNLKWEHLEKYFGEPRRDLDIALMEREAQFIRAIKVVPHKAPLLTAMFEGDGAEAQRLAQEIWTYDAEAERLTYTGAAVVMKDYVKVVRRVHRLSVGDARNPTYSLPVPVVVWLLHHGVVAINATYKLNAFPCSGRNMAVTHTAIEANEAPRVAGYQSVAAIVPPSFTNTGYAEDASPHKDTSEVDPNDPVGLRAAIEAGNYTEAHRIAHALWYYDPTSGRFSVIRPTRTGQNMGDNGCFKGGTRLAYGAGSLCARSMAVLMHKTCWPHRIVFDSEMAEGDETDARATKMVYLHVPETRDAISARVAARPAPPPVKKTKRNPKRPRHVTLSELDPVETLELMREKWEVDVVAGTIKGRSHGAYLPKDEDTSRGKYAMIAHTVYPPKPQPERRVAPDGTPYMTRPVRPRPTSTRLRRAEIIWLFATGQWPHRLRHIGTMSDGRINYWDDGIASLENILPDGTVAP